MKITKRQILDIISRADIPAIAEGYNSMSSAGKGLANAAKRRFKKDYPDVDVGIDGHDGWITVNGKKAVNMSQASGSPLSLDDVIDEMKKTYLGRTVQEGTKMKITRTQLRRIIKEEKRKLVKENMRHPETGENLPLMLDDIVNIMLEQGMNGSELAKKLRDLADQVEDQWSFM